MREGHVSTAGGDDLGWEGLIAAAGGVASVATAGGVPLLVAADGKILLAGVAQGGPDHGQRGLVCDYGVEISQLRPRGWEASVAGSEAFLAAL